MMKKNKLDAEKAFSALLRQGSPHRFTAETAPRQGGKKGRRFKWKKTKLQELFEERMDHLMHMSLENIERAIESGDVATSMWFIGQRLKKRDRKLLRPLQLAVKNLDDVERVSLETVERALSGKMTFEEAKAIQETLARHSALSGMVELSRLREELDQFKAAQGVDDKMSVDHMPAWGRLKEVMGKPAPIQDVARAEPMQCGEMPDLPPHK